MPMSEGLLSNVPLGTANFLAYTMMVLIAVFLVFGPTVGYYLWRKRKRMSQADTAGAPTEAA